MKYPIGIQNFEKIRREGYVYVDKTQLMWKMVSEGSYYFLSRPRRFGKSLMISTLEAFFSGERELFKGLYVDSVEWDWQQYPILHLDLNTEKYDSKEALENKLNLFLSTLEKTYGKNPDEKSFGTRFEGIIQRTFEKTGRQAVILVDEYDKPLLQAIGNESLQEEYRNTLKAFYGALKSADRYIKFAFLTGVTNWGKAASEREQNRACSNSAECEQVRSKTKVSVFSDLNNLTDISMLPSFSNICGITEKELHQYFDDSVSEVADNNGISKEQCYEELRNNFDGYYFNEYTKEGIYNPFSVLNTLRSGVFRDYWFETGTPSFLVYQLQKTGYPLDNMTEEELSADTLNSIDVMDVNPLPLLYQSGYLTIKDYDPEFKTYRLGFPNREVREGFIKYLYPFYTPKTQDLGRFAIVHFVKDIRSGHAEAFMTRLSDFFATGDYQVMGRLEIYLQNTLNVIFNLMGLYVEVERLRVGEQSSGMRHTTNGRMDMVIQTPLYVYIIELKIDQTAAVALQQIEDRGYANAFAGDTRKLFKIGINFSSEKKLIDDWKISVCPGRPVR